MGRGEGSAERLKGLAVPPELGQQEPDVGAGGGGELADVLALAIVPGLAEVPQRRFEVALALRRDTDCARGFGLNIGSAGDDANAAEDSARDSFLMRSSLQVAQGQFSRR